MIVRSASLGALDGVRHAFFTRKGGVSEGIYASLNCGFSSGDHAERVRANRARAMERLGTPPGSLCTVRQVHGREVAVVRGPDAALAATEADALVTDRPGVTLGVLTADCAPVLLADPERGVIGAVHAGWRGALAGVIEAAVGVMLGLGARRESVRAAIGPCIAQGSYEVGPELRAAFVAEEPGSGALFAPVAGSDRLLFDLRGYALRRLARAGVADAAALPVDTYGDPSRWFSSRRARHRGDGRFGLLLSA
ncbi:MAG TPA: peptidoglycan editing factor PgeF, partial [Geminicoccaceae bacterium]|nr:peptidoglycan editing factor PgeF [Geminicoccaceae bacterium]